MYSNNNLFSSKEEIFKNMDSLRYICNGLFYTVMFITQIDHKKVNSYLLFHACYIFNFK